MTDTWLAVIAICQVLGILVLVFAAIRFGGIASAVSEKLERNLEALQAAIGNLDNLLRDLRDQGVVDKAAGALDDATQTSQSVRARVDDLAAMQSELTAMTRALTDVSCEIRDKELAGKLANVLSDTSLLAADIGILTENASSILERGKPLVSNIESVVTNAKQRASGISGTLGSIKEGIKAGAEAWREQGKDKGKGE